MATELIMLGCAASLAIVLIVLQALACSLDLSFPYALGPRDEAKAVKGIYAGRLQRALANFMETFPLFAAVALGVVAAHHEGGMSALGSQLYVWGRLAHAPLYVLGVPYLRSLAFGVALAGIIMMLMALLR